MSIRKDFFSGIRWTSFSSLLSFVLGLLQVAILARFLEKSDFAWVAIAGVFVNIGIQLQQAGINTAIVQHATLTKTQLSTAYWLNVIIGGILFAVAAVMAVILCWVYESRILLSIFILYSVIFLIHAFTVQYKALLQKNFHFKALSVGESLGIISGFIFAVVTAINGWGAYALVGAYVTRYLAEAIWILIAGRQQFRPALEWNWRSVQPLVDFGGWHLTERLVTHFSSQIDILLIGKLLGSEALGTYDVFKRILVRPLNLLNDIFEKVTFPVFSKFQNEVELQKKLYLSLLAHLGAINFPLLAFLVLAAAPVIQLVLGSQWVAGVPVFQLLCLFCLLHYLLNPVDTLLLSLGKIRIWLFANLAFLPVQIIFIMIGSSFNLTIITLAHVLAYTLFTSITYYFIVLPQIQSNITEVIKSLARPLILTTISTFFLLPFQLFNLNVMLFIIMSLLFAIIYLLLTVFYNRDFINLVRQFLAFKS